jgi:pyruvate/2-oxoglutarate dehydrogenase complex dihydrolipoamide dehydrogenase (E3) component
LASADILAPNADELIASVALAIRQKISTGALAKAIFPYPTLSQALIFAAKRFPET